MNKGKAKESQCDEKKTHPSISILEYLLDEEGYTTRPIHSHPDCTVTVVSRSLGFLQGRDVGVPGTVEYKRISIRSCTQYRAQPQFVSHTNNRDTIRSREGLLNIDSGDEEDLDVPISPISPITPSIEEKVDLQRATSVRMDPGHARNFSAGSAKLLEIHPRASADGKRLSQERFNGV